LAVAQKNKIRIIMDLSAPEGSSYNDAINESALGKVSMSSARLFNSRLRQGSQDVEI
jgi:hypothetical protein